MKFSRNNNAILNKAKHLLKWERLLDSVFTMVKDGKRPEKMIYNLEQALQLFLANNLGSVNVVQTPTQKKSGQGVPAFESETAPLARRRDHLSYLTRTFGIDAVSCMFYSMLSTRILNALNSVRYHQCGENMEEYKKRSYIYLHEMVSMIPDDLTKFRNLSNKSIAEIELVLGRFGLRLGMSGADIEKCFNSSDEER